MSQKNTKHIIITFCQLFAAAVLTVVDGLIKNAVTTGLKGKDNIVLIEKVIGLTYTENTGAAFSFMSNNTLILSVLTSVVLLAGIVFLFTGKLKSKILNVCAVMILAGGAGNLYDRFTKGYVVDYIQTLFVNFPVYNFADILVTCGVVIVCIYMIYDIIQDEKKKKITEQKDAVNEEA